MNKITKINIDDIEYGIASTEDVIYYEKDWGETISISGFTNCNTDNSIGSVKFHSKMKCIYMSILIQRPTSTNDLEFCKFTVPQEWHNYIPLIQFVNPVVLSNGSDKGIVGGGRFDIYVNDREWSIHGMLSSTDGMFQLLATIPLIYKE